MQQKISAADFIVTADICLIDSFSSDRISNVSNLVNIFTARSTLPEANLWRRLWTLYSEIGQCASFVQLFEGCYSVSSL
jgi:hypothetical protein